MRHLNDLKRIKNDKNFPYIFSKNRAVRIVMFAEMIRHWKGTHAGQRIYLQPHQVFYFSMIFGWVHRDTKLRRFTTSYKEVARKNGKTTEAAIKSIYHMLLDGEHGAQVYFTATKEQQARIALTDMKNFIKGTPELGREFEILASSVITTQGFGSAKPLGSDSKTQDGFDPSWGVVDEYHSHRDDSMLNVLESGMGARQQPMIDVITTAGFNRQSSCYRLRKTIVDILEGTISDDRTFGIIFSMDENDDWRDPINFRKANPNINISVSAQFIEDRITKALNEGGTKEVDVKTKNLNQWTDAAKVWIPARTWRRNIHNTDMESLIGQRCYGGLDLAKGIDLNAFVLFFPESMAILSFFFMPEAKIKENNDKVDYQLWVDQGHIITTPGVVIDHSFIVHKILELSHKYNIVSIAYDRFLSHHGTIQGLIKQNVYMSELGQGFVSLSYPTKELETLATSLVLEHFANPVLAWMISNVELATDPAGNIKPDKGRSSNKIDGVAALVNAIGEWKTKESTTNNARSMYDNWDDTEEGDDMEGGLLVL
jgi:phage terminase large subunit-like protein